MNSFMLATFNLLCAHYIADFIFQSQQMAENKSKSKEWLTKHVAVYTVVLAFASFPLLFVITLANFIKFIIINGCLHWAVDFVTSKMTAKRWKEARYHDMFVVIGADQLIHMCTLLTTFYLFA